MSDNPLCLFIFRGEILKSFVSAADCHCRMVDACG
jgi:hypothetical protein